MGSLMAGWNCSVLDPETARLERNRSLTKEEIESFWKVRRKSCDGAGEQEQPPSPTSPLMRSPRAAGGGGEGGEEAAGRKKSLFWQALEKSKTSPPVGGEQQPESPDKVVATRLTGDWWTRSSWAFLNEPPHDEVDDSAHKYAAQYHVAQIAAVPTRKQHVN